jgi:hypothetical protein
MSNDETLFTKFASKAESKKCQSLPQDTSTLTTALADSSVAASPVQEKPATFRFLDEEEEEISGTTPADTITVNSQSLEGPGIFKGHLLQVRQSKAQPIVPSLGDWFTISLLISTLPFHLVPLFLLSHLPATFFSLL